MTFRDFSSQRDLSATRTLEDAPPGLRNEFIDLVFHHFEVARTHFENKGTAILYPLSSGGRKIPDFSEARLYMTITQSLGLSASAQPYGGFRYAAGRDIQKVEWPRFYDLISRLWVLIFEPLRTAYVDGVNRILAGYRSAWDLGGDGQCHRVLPVAVHHQVEAVFKELSQPRFASGLTLFHHAMSAYDDRPQRGREVCASIFDALESVAKEVFSLPSATFGNVLLEARKRQPIASETIAVQQKLYDMANAHFRHGMTTPFTLKPAEVDFVLVSCFAGILLFLRL
jgi:hypothetical protein